MIILLCTCSRIQNKDPRRYARVFAGDPSLAQKSPLVLTLGCVLKLEAVDVAKPYVETVSDLLHTIELHGSVACACTFRQVQHRPLLE